MTDVTAAEASEADPRADADAAAESTAKRRPWLPWAAVLVVVLLVGAGAAWSQLGGAAGARPVEVGSADAEDRVDITATIVRVDAASGELVLRMLVVPRGSLTTEGGLSPAEDLEILTSAAMKTDPFFPANERIASVDVPVALGGGAITAYPFDRYDATLEFTARQGGSIVPVHLELTNRDALFGMTAEGFEESNAAVVELGLARSVSVMTFAIFMILAMWALAIAVAIGAWVVVSERRGLVWPALGWMAATLFAIAGFRNAAPGAPPIGSLIDYLAFFWAEAIIAVCLFATVVGGVRAERAQSR
ncbi:DUF4436 domain-containing protein [Agromyces sp. NPDC058136]|uniref:DUF4436 domain-containing protein n=1 Tax=Agromyces sp. NPDC058136 TaxID=3346354 RepID=UPI0036D817EA